MSELIDHNCGIYRIVNTRNGKSYIGSSKDLRARYKDHQKALRKGNHHSIYLQRAWNLELDKTVFTYAPFIFCRECDLLAIEQKCFDVMHPEYNISLIAGRFEQTEEHKKYMSALMSGRRLSKKTREKLSLIASQRVGDLNPFYGKEHSSETKNHLSEETIKRFLIKGHPRKGEKLSEESRLKISLATTGKREGHKNINCKLSPDQVLEIKKSEDKIKIISEKFSISMSQVKRIRYGIAWKCINKEQHNG